MVTVHFMDTLGDLCQNNEERFENNPFIHGFRSEFQRTAWVDMKFGIHIAIMSKKISDTVSNSAFVQGVSTRRYIYLVQNNSGEIDRFRDRFELHLKAKSYNNDRY